MQKTQRLLFYCQHILGIGHLVRSMEIARGLTQDFKICFVNGGKAIEGFPIPAGVEVANLPAIETDPEFQELRAVDPSLSLETVQEMRTLQLQRIFDDFQPDVLLVELYPFGRRRFSFELKPLMERAKALGTRVACSLRDIVVTKQDRARHEEKVCRLLNRYFDLLLVHGDRRFVPLERSFSRVGDVRCPVRYTGYVVQQPPARADLDADGKPSILVSVGGGRFGRDLLEGVARAAPLLAEILPHHIHMFAGPFSPEPVFEALRAIAATQTNLTVERYTPHFLSYMQQADLSISMSGYNTTMNLLTAGVPALMLPFTGNGDREQTIRVQRLEELGLATMLRGEHRDPQQLVAAIRSCLQKEPVSMSFDLNGVENTADCLRQLVRQQQPTLAATA